MKKDSDVFWMDPMTVEMLMMAALLQLSPFSVLFWAAFFNKGRKAWEKQPGGMPVPPASPTATQQVRRSSGKPGQRGVGAQAGAIPSLPMPWEILGSALGPPP